MRLGLLCLVGVALVISCDGEPGQATAALEWPTWPQSEHGSAFEGLVLDMETRDSAMSHAEVKRVLEVAEGRRRMLTNADALVAGRRYRVVGSGSTDAIAMASAAEIDTVADVMPDFNVGPQRTLVLVGAYGDRPAVVGNAVLHD